MACKHCGGHTTGNNKFCSRSHATSYNNRKRIRVPAGVSAPKGIRKMRFPTECPICGKLHKNKIYCSQSCNILSKRVKAMNPDVPDVNLDPFALPLQGDAAI